jgi:hypothetical protein
MQVIRSRLVDVGLGLQQDAERALQAHGLLRGGDRTLASHGQRHHEAGKEHESAYRDDDQRVIGQRAVRVVPPWRCLGRRSVDPGAAIGQDRMGVGARRFVHYPIPP